MSKLRIMRRVGVVATLLGLLLLATAAPASPAAPAGATLGLSVASEYWAEHPGCVTVDVTLDGVADVGGYETRLTYDTTHLGYSGGNITLSDFLTAGGTRSHSGDDGTPLLEATDTNNVMFGDYSWGTNAGASASNSVLATVALDGVACGTGTLSLSDSQVVDYQGNVLTVDSEATNVPVTIHGIYDTNGSGGNVTAADVSTVLNGVGTSSACTANYYLDVNKSGGNITAADVSLVLNNVGTPSCP